MYNKRKQSGATILEVLLVLAIVAAMVLLGIRQYVNYRRSADVEQLKQTIDIIFKGMSDFYRANCFGQYNPATNRYTFSVFRTSAGSPLVTTTANNTLVINMDTQLRGTPKYINLTDNQFRSPLIDYTKFQHGFHLQFVRGFLDVFVCTEGINATGIDPASGCTKKVKVGQVVVWTPQVTVQPSAAITAQQLRNVADATCTTNVVGTYTTPCPLSSPSSTAAVSWMRQPSMPTRGTTSTYSFLMPTLNAFTQMYQSDGILYLTSTQPNATGTRVHYLYCN